MFASYLVCLVLLPSLFPDLRRAASGGPVITINASKYILLNRDPVHIPLEIIQEGVRDLSTEFHTLTIRARRVDVARELAAFLRKSRDQIVSPIVDFLRMTHPSRSRIWLVSHCRVFFGGSFRKGQQNLPGIYISSYCTLPP
ncbi:hypothetical protein HD554DRAFT_1470620 [Boletus coccyginus]|nr:hypothetical protein HD554DRAFT_1470620 [Boletus coccyginus]